MMADADERAEYARAYAVWIARGGMRARVQLHPATDDWMRGDRFGDVVGMVGGNLRVKLDKSGLTRMFACVNLLEVV